MKTILVAGGAGFIGHHLCKQLMSEGHFVIILDNLLTGSKKNIIQSDQCKHVQLAVENGKYIDAMNISPLRIDEIYHLASPASPVHYMAYPWSTISANTQGTYNLMSLALREGSKLLFASTSEVYGDPDRQVQKENYYGNVNTQGNRAPYDESKRMGETLIATSNRENETKFKIARIFNTYGPNMSEFDGRAIPEFICRALRGEDLDVFGDGLQNRSFCYVDDLVDGLIRLMESDETGPINLGNPEECYSILEVARKICEAIPGKHNINITNEWTTDDDPLMRCPDIKLAMEKLLWAPKIDINKGLERTIEYFKGVI
jgi:UDP-glucuronate decarboxylase